MHELGSVLMQIYRACRSLQGFQAAPSVHCAPAPSAIAGAIAVMWHLLFLPFFRLQLHLFWTPTALRMCYRGYSYPLMLFLEEGGVVTVCKINTQEPDELLDFDFCSTNVVNKVILQSEGLREAFAELDMTSEVLQITMSPDKPYFRLSTFGNAGSAHLDYPRDSDLMEAFHCNQTQTNRYKISLLKPSTKALALSCKVSIRTDAQGFLSLQYMIRNEDGQICFVEYYCCPDEDITDAEL
ncbi:cell cycle checkpoint protein RAD1 isoform X2 [Haliaeetus albicilla]|uniref:cell cycle checkpoint protein RAD1 isoform X2 n=1 Tax=Haliaeetus albicilla TaxID=8969 RepID=UPI0037E73623